MVRCHECNNEMDIIPQWLTDVKVRFVCENCRQRHPKPSNILDADVDIKLPKSAIIDEPLAGIIDDVDDPDVDDPIIDIVEADFDEKEPISEAIDDDLSPKLKGKASKKKAAPIDMGFPEDTIEVVSLEEIELEAEVDDSKFDD